MTSLLSNVASLVIVLFCSFKARLDSLSLMMVALRDLTARFKFWLLLSKLHVIVIGWWIGADTSGKASERGSTASLAIFLLLDGGQGVEVFFCTRLFL